MSQDYLCIGVDIGGSHLAACLVEAVTGHVAEASGRRARVDARGDAESVLRQWCAPIGEVLASAGPCAVRGIGVAMPGPFDYEGGVSLISGLEKYDSLLGMNIREELRARLGLRESMPVVFENDAGCFALGEAINSGGRVIGVTLGTGLGSGFVAGGRLQKEGPGVPPEGYLYAQPWEGSRAEDLFSGRGVRALHRARTGEDYKSAALLARDAGHDPRALATWQDYGAQLGRFLGTWAAAFQADEVVLGGSISNAWDLFGPGLEAAVRGARPGCLVRPSRSAETAAMAGAARLVLQRHGDRADA